MTFAGMILRARVVEILQSDKSNIVCPYMIADICIELYKVISALESEFLQLLLWLFEVCHA